MNGILKNIYYYHIASIILGFIYFYASNIIFNIIGSSALIIFELYEPTSPSVYIALLANLAVGFIGSLLPATVISFFFHYILRPKTKLFLISITLSFIILSIWGAFGLLSVTNETVYLLGYIGKALGSLFALWLLIAIYFKLMMPNKALNTDSAKNAAPVS